MKNSKCCWTFLLTSTLLLILLNGCSESGSPTDTKRRIDTVNPFNTNPTGPIKAWLAASVTDNDWYRYTDINQTQVRFTSDADYKIVDAVFYNSAQVDPGIVEFDNTSLLNNGSNYFYRQPIGVSCDGGNYVWSVQGSNDFPAFTDSLTAPRTKARIVSPSVYNLVSKNSPLTIVWSNAQANSMVQLILQGDPSTTNLVYYSILTDDDGSYTIPASVFQSKPNQKVTITLNRGTYKIGELPGGSSYLLTIYSQHNVDVRLTD